MHHPTAGGCTVTQSTALANAADSLRRRGIEMGPSPCIISLVLAAYYSMTTQ